MRTLEQLRERVSQMSDHDIFGLAVNDLRAYDPDCFAPENRDKALKLETAAEDSEKALREYMSFAFEKASNHRGISAGRSVMHICNWLWLMERDDLLAFAEKDGNYKNYGVPILKHVASALDIDMPANIRDWPDGGMCGPVCDAGCE